jgi:hypothetical protein
MIDATNYYEKIKQIDLSSLPEVLKKSHDFVDKTTYKGSNWNTYNDNANIKRIIDTYFQKLIPYVNSFRPEKPKAEPTQVPRISPSPTTTKPTKEKAQPKPKKVKQQEPDPVDDIDFVERIPDELKFIRRYINLHNKRKGKEDLLRFINALHRSILEKKIRKASQYSKEIEYIQDKLVKTYNTMERPMTMQVSDKIIADYKALLGQEKVMPSVLLMKRYISLNGKYGVKDKAAKLIEAMKKAAAKKKVLKNDKYASILNKMFENLTAYVKNKSQKILSIQETELNGLNGVLGECGCQVGEVNGLEGVELTETETIAEIPEVMNSMDFKNLEFKTLGFTGKYKELIGDPAKGFTAMVYGRPKMGKSFLCVDFAGYLARNHGKVLYVAKEEGLDMTLQQKLKAKDVAHPNLFVSESLPAKLTAYDFIFLDSVNKLGLTAGDLETLKVNNPGKSFIYIFQTNKDGNFRGANEFQHDVDVVIEVPEKGTAVQNGRFNQGGEMKIFN